MDVPRRRLVKLPIAYRGFTLENGFLFGYGLDFRERYRNLPYLGLLEERALSGGRIVEYESERVTGLRVSEQVAGSDDVGTSGAAC